MSGPVISAFGVFGVHASAIHRDEALCERLAKLCVDRRWPWPLAVVGPTQKPGAPLYPWPKGRLSPSKLEDAARAILRSDSTCGFHGSVSRTPTADHAFAHIDAGHADFTGRATGTMFPFDAKLLCRANTPETGSIDVWIELVHEIVGLLDSPNAVILARANERYLQSILYGSGGASDGTGDARDIARVNRARHELGARWIRPAEWGTYLSAKHVETIGRARIVATAATSRDVGSLLYVQCSASAADAFTTEAEARRQALRALLAPITL